MSLEEKAKALDFRGFMVSAIITAMAFVCGLFWRDAISETIAVFTPAGEGILYSYVAAILATVFVVILAFVLMKTQTIKLEKLLGNGDENADIENEKKKKKRRKKKK